MTAEDRDLFLQTLIAEGLSFSDCVAAFAGKRDAFDLAAVEAAKTDGRLNDDLEIDDEPMTSRGDDASGCFVMSWLYVSRHQIDTYLENTDA